MSEACGLLSGHYTFVVLTLLLSNLLLSQSYIINKISTIFISKKYFCGSLRVNEVGLYLCRVPRLYLHLINLQLSNIYSPLPTHPNKINVSYPKTTFLLFILFHNIMSHDFINFHFINLFIYNFFTLIFNPINS